MKLYKVRNVETNQYWSDSYKTHGWNTFGDVFYHIKNAKDASKNAVFQTNVSSENCYVPFSRREASKHIVIEELEYPDKELLSNTLIKYVNRMAYQTSKRFKLETSQAKASMLSYKSSTEGFLNYMCTVGGVSYYTSMNNPDQRALPADLKRNDVIIVKVGKRGEDGKIKSFFHKHINIRDYTILYEQK